MAEHKFQCAVGDRSTPLSVRLWEPGKDNDLTGLTVAFAMDELDGTNKTAKTVTGITIQPTQTFTADTTNRRYNCVAHGMQDEWEVIVSTSAADLPAPLSATTRYFVKDSRPNYFKLCTEPNGPEIPPTDAGTGTHSIAVVGMVQYAWAAADVSSAKSYRAWFVITDGDSLDRTFPNTAEGITVEVVGAN